MALKIASHQVTSGTKTTGLSPITHCWLKLNYHSEILIFMAYLSSLRSLSYKQKSEHVTSFLTINTKRCPDSWAQWTNKLILLRLLLATPHLIHVNYAHFLKHMTCSFMSPCFYPMWCILSFLSYYVNLNCPKLTSMPYCHSPDKISTLCGRSNSMQLNRLLILSVHVFLPWKREHFYFLSGIFSI